MVTAAPASGEAEQVANALLVGTPPMWVGRRADVPGARPRGVHEDLVLEALTPRDVLEDALSKGGTAYIAHTNEQDADHS